VYSQRSWCVEQSANWLALARHLRGPSQKEVKTLHCYIAYRLSTCCLGEFSALWEIFYLPKSGSKHNKLTTRKSTKISRTLLKLFTLADFMFDAAIRWKKTTTSWQSVQYTTLWHYNYYQLNIKLPSAAFERRRTKFMRKFYRVHFTWMSHTVVTFTLTPFHFSFCSPFGSYLISTRRRRSEKGVASYIMAVLYTTYNLLSLLTEMSVTPQNTPSENFPPIENLYSPEYTVA